MHSFTKFLLLGACFMTTFEAMATCPGAKTCSNGTATWCCAIGTGCSDTANQCIGGCSYTFKLPGNANNNANDDTCVYTKNMAVIKGCGNGKYCYLRYGDDTCDSWYTNGDRIYGKCIGMNENETAITSCRDTANHLGCCEAAGGEIVTDMAVVEPIQSCSSGYCYIRWDANGNLLSQTTGTFYGICLPSDKNFGQNYLNLTSLADEDKYNPWKI